MPESARRRSPGNLPSDLTTFVDRRDELAQIKKLFTAGRLVTLTGPGGVGKTRLAVRAARAMRRGFPDGVWLANVAGIQDPTLLVHAVTAALGLRDEARRWDLSTLVKHLREQRLLLVLDNCEHQRDAVATLVAAALSADPAMRVLVTSRELLGVTGEHVVQVRPLCLPQRDAPMQPLKLLAQCDSVQLFADRARCVLPDFTVDEGNRAALTEVCCHLEGIPLAIEMAVVRLRSLSLEQLRDRLRDRYRVLTGAGRDLPARQRTLRALFDWSFGLCSATEQIMWARSSVFRDGFELQAAETICAGEGLATDDVFESVSGLIDKSVLHRVEQRYGMLETLREYGWNRLRERGETEALLRRHGTWYQDLVTRAEQGSFNADQLAWFGRLRRDHANLRVAMEHGLADPRQAGTVLRMAAGLRYYWLAAGYLGEGRRWLDLALAAHQQPTPERTRALWVDAWLALMQGDVATAGPLLRECGDLAREHSDSVAQAWVSQLTGYAAMNEGNLSEAQVWYREALARHRNAADEPGTVHVFLRIATLAVLTGDIDAGVAACREGLALCDALGERFVRSALTWALGLLHWRRHHTTEAAALMTDSLRLSMPFDDRVGITRAVEALAWIAVSEGRNEYAAVLLGAADRAWRSFGGALFPYLRGYRDQCEARVRAALDPATYRAAFARGAQTPHDTLLSHILTKKAEVTPRVSASHAVPDVATTSLTHREREVADLVATGKSNKEIATQLLIAQRTAETHVEHILIKLGFTSRSQIAAWTAEHNDRTGGGSGE